jgi:hypothetical protein
MALLFLPLSVGLKAGDLQPTSRQVVFMCCLHNPLPQSCQHFSEQTFIHHGTQWMSLPGCRHPPTNHSQHHPPPTNQPTLNLTSSVRFKINLRNSVRFSVGCLLVPERSVRAPTSTIHGRSDAFNLKTSDRHCSNLMAKASGWR